MIPLDPDYHETWNYRMQQKFNDVIDDEFLVPIVLYFWNDLS